MEQNEAHPHSKEHQHHHQHRGLGTSLTHWLTQRERNVKSGTTGLTLEMDEERGWEQKCVSLCCPVFFWLRCFWNSQELRSEADRGPRG